MPEDKTLARLTERIEGDSHPVEPIPRASRRAAWLLPYALVAAAVVLLTYGLRRDASDLGGWFVWGLAAAQLITAYGILVTFLRDSTPGRAVRPMAWMVSLVLVLVTQQGIAWLTFGRSPILVLPERALSVGARCLGSLSMFGIVPMLAGLVWLSQGLPLRPRISGLATGIAGGLTAEAVYRLHCPFSHWSHMIVWHGGAVLLLGALGFAAGVSWERRLRRAWEKRRGD